MLFLFEKDGLSSAEGLLHFLVQMKGARFARNRSSKLILLLGFM